MGKEQAIKIHYTEICDVLDAWVQEEEEEEIKGAIEKIKPLVKVLEWTYVDEQDFSLSAEAEKRQAFAKKQRRQRYENYNNYNNEDGEEGESMENDGEEQEINISNQAPKETSEKQSEKGAEAPEELDTADKMDETEENGNDKKTRKENGPNEREERDDSIVLDEDLFHKLGYGITSQITLSSMDGTASATLRLRYSSHNWDIINYEKPDFNLYSFSNTFSLGWENNPASPSPSSSSSSATTTTSSSSSTTTSTSTTTTNTNGDVIATETTSVTSVTEVPPTSSELPGPGATDFSTLIAGDLYGDKSKFNTYVNFTSENLTNLRRYLKYDEKEGLFFTEENFAMLLYFVAVCMSIEDQPFNELPALISSKVRRFFMKQILYELGADVTQYKYVIENLSYAMQEIKERAKQERYSFGGGSSSSHIIFGSDDEGEEEKTMNAKRGLEEQSDGHSKKIKPSIN